MNKEWIGEEDEDEDDGEEDEKWPSVKQEVVQQQHRETRVNSSSSSHNKNKGFNQLEICVLCLSIYQAKNYEIEFNKIFLSKFHSS